MFKSSNAPSRPSEVARHSVVKSGQHANNEAPKDYPYRLSFYNRPPFEEITIEQFEEWALDRLRVLADIEALLTRNRPVDEIAKVLAPRLKQYLPLSSNTAHVDLLAERRKDHIGHFVLRLAFCRTQELRQRFIKAESTLFRIRFEGDSLEERKNFLETLNFDWQPLSQTEKNELHNELKSATPFLKNFESEAYFRVHWTKVTDLVEKRRVYLKGGQAYVPMSMQLSLIMAEFNSRLDRALEATARALPRLDEDDRLLPVLNHLSMGFMAGVSSEFSYNADGANGELVTAGMVNDLIVAHAPACMRNLSTTLRTSKHLKHFGRQQFNLFLKGIGLPIEEALVFWRKSFSTITDDKFNKEYRYNIRHGYGLEGGRKNYAPKDCQRILTSDTPGPQDSHGCPYRHFSAQNLQSLLLTQYGISDPAQIKEILDAQKSQHYHVACTRVFEITHARRYDVKKGDGLGNGESVSHPNRYFERSRELERIANGEVPSVAGQAGATTPPGVNKKEDADEMHIDA